MSNSPTSTVDVTRPTDRVRAVHTSPLLLFQTSSMSSARRLKRIKNALATSTEVIGTLTLGDISYPVPASRTPSRLPHLSPLDPNDVHTREHLYFLLQKFVLGQDVFLLAQPGPYARRLALTFCKCAHPSAPISHKLLTRTQLTERRVRVYRPASRRW